MDAISNLGIVCGWRDCVQQRDEMEEGSGGIGVNEVGEWERARMR